jgi:hypothetical protein
MVEAYAAWKAVVLGRNLSFYNVILEGDALVVHALFDECQIVFIWTH